MPVIVFEFMELGDLTEVLRKRSPWKQLASASTDKNLDRENGVQTSDKNLILSNRDKLERDNEKSFTDEENLKQLTRVSSINSN